MSTAVKAHEPSAPASEVAPWERADFDWKAWYLTDEEDMGQSGEQYACIQHLVGVLEQWRHERGLDAQELFIGADQFFELHPTDKSPRVSPDLYLLRASVPSPLPPSWALGAGELLLAVEIVSDEEWRKDYANNPLKYQRLGAREFVIFDPDWLLKPKARRRTTQPPRAGCTLYRPDAQGVMRIVDQGDGPFYSELLDAWWVVLQIPGTFRLALARDAGGIDIILTREDAEHLRAENERRRAEAAEAEREAERQRAEGAEAEREAERLRAEAERLRAEAESQRAEDAEAERKAERLRAEQAEAEREAERLRAEVERQRAEDAEAKGEAERQRAEQAEAEREAERQRAEQAEAEREAERQRAQALASELERLRALLGRSEHD